MLKNMILGVKPAHDRTDTETQTAAAAAAFLAGALQEQEETARRLNAAAEAKEEARRRTAWEKANAVPPVRMTLRTLRRNGRTMLGTEKRRKVAMLTDLADKVGDQLTRSEINQIKAWKARVQGERKPPERAPKSDRHRNTGTGQ